MCTGCMRAGEALISAYCKMGLDDLWKPDLRSKIEASIRDVAAGRTSRDTVGWAGLPQRATPCHVRDVRSGLHAARMRSVWGC